MFEEASAVVGGSRTRGLKLHQPHLFAGGKTLQRRGKGGKYEVPNDIITLVRI